MHVGADFDRTRVTYDRFPRGTTRNVLPLQILTIHNSDLPGILPVAAHSTSGINNVTLLRLQNWQPPSPSASKYSEICPHSKGFCAQRTRDALTSNSLGKRIMRINKSHLRCPVELRYQHMHVAETPCRWRSSGGSK